MKKEWSLCLIIILSINSIDDMELQIYLKGKIEPTVFVGERIDVLDINIERRAYKQIRYFRKGVSKSQYISVDLIKKIKEISK